MNKVSRKIISEIRNLEISRQRNEIWDEVVKVYIETIKSNPKMCKKVEKALGLGWKLSKNSTLEVAKFFNEENYSEMTIKSDGTVART